MFNSAPAFRHPIINSDQRFFKANPRRKLLIRPYHQGEFDFDRLVTFFMDDGEGNAVKPDTIIVRRTPFFRKKKPFYCGSAWIANTDHAILAFLRRMGIDPETLQPVSP